MRDETLKIIYPLPGVTVDTTIAQHAIDGKRVTISMHGRDTLQPKLEAMKGAGRRALVLDFDGTITVNGSPVPAAQRRRTGEPVRPQYSTWQEVRFQSGFSPIAQEMMDADVARFKDFADYESQIEWADRTYWIYYFEGVTRQKIERVADNIRVRRRVIDVMRAYIDYGHRVGIVSYGIGDIIERVLHNNGIREGVDIYADRLMYDSDDRVVGALPESRVVGANKDQRVQEFVSKAGMENSDRIIVVGDAYHDLGMLRALRILNSDGLGIYLHHNGHKRFNYSGLHLVADSADIVASNLRDTSFRPVFEVIQYALGRRIA